jgi:RNA polymerase sigma-70 factor (ECF subfamily)
MTAVYVAHRRVLLARALQITGDPALAEDAVQEAMVRAWRACASFDADRGPVGGWLLTITGNVAIDLVRARSRRPWLALLPSDDGPAAPGISDLDLLLLRHQLGAAVRGLSEPQAVAVVETFLRDRPYAQVAAELGIPGATLRTRVHHALHRLRDDLSELDTAA